MMWKRRSEGRRFFFDPVATTQSDTILSDSYSLWIVSPIEQSLPDSTAP